MRASFMNPTLVAVALLGLTNACQNASAAPGYEISGQLKNAPAGTTLHLSELTSSQFVERGTATTDAQGKLPSRVRSRPPRPCTSSSSMSPTRYCWC